MASKCFSAGSDPKSRFKRSIALNFALAVKQYEHCSTAHTAVDISSRVELCGADLPPAQCITKPELLLTTNQEGLRFPAHKKNDLQKIHLERECDC